MYPRTEYEMSDADLESILSASRAVPAMFLSGGTPMFGTPQDNANRAWAALGTKMGFDCMTVRPVSGKGQRFFTAIPNETEEARNERLAREAEDKRFEDIKRIHSEIAERQQQLANLYVEQKIHEEERREEKSANSQFGVGD